MKLLRLYPILDTATLARRGMPFETAAEVMLASGVGILQLRHKDAFDRDLFEATERVAARCRAAGVTFIINDRADIARLVDAGGVHVGQEDMPVAEVRRLLGDDQVLGFSTHNPAQLASATDADYVALGPIFGTASKENPDPVVGLDQLREWRGLNDRPLVAIGGITLETAAAVLGAGADSVAVISALYPDPLTPDTLAERLQAWKKTLGA